MGRPKDFPNIYQDLLTKYKAKGIADKEYKECLLLARVSCPLLLFPNRSGSSPDACVPSLEQEQGLTKEARLDDVDSSEQTRQVKSSVKKEKPDSSGPLLKKQRVSGAFSHSEKELYERLVEAERQRAEAEKARGDDLHEIAMALASGKKGELVAVSALFSMLSSNS